MIRTSTNTRRLANAKSEISFECKTLLKVPQWTRKASPVKTMLIGTPDINAVRALAEICL
ncbi:MAG: hypothetical protein WCE23_16355 [Candidatus Binatus sp.]